MSARHTCLAELLGTAALLCAVIGSGIMAENLAGGNVAVALLANTLATVFALYVLIETLGPISGAHFNPAVTLVMAMRGALPPTLAGAYVVAQLIGAALGAWVAHAMFGLFAKFEPLIDGAFAAPAKRVDAGINHQSCRAPHFVDQSSEVCIRIVLKESHLDA